MNYEYCPNCGHKSTIQAESDTAYVCKHCSWRLWNNPKAAVSALLFNKQGEVLFAKRGIEPEKGKYDLPGGFLEYGEDPYEACRRELAEETLLKIQKKDLRLLEVFTVPYIPGTTAVDIIMVVTEWQGEFRAQDDVAALEWHPIDFIDGELMRPRYPGLVRKIRHYLTNSSIL